MSGSGRVYGLLAEFSDPGELVAAARRATEEGYTHVDAYSPFPLEEAAEALGFHRNALPLLVLVGGLLGMIGGFALCYWTSAIDYPINVAGRPLNSWPAFIPITFESTVLLAGLTAVFGMLALNGLPMPHHPLFNVPQFALASRDRFFLCIRATDPKFEFDETWGFLSRLGPRQVSQVDDD